MGASSQLVDPKFPEGFMSIPKSAEVVHEHPSVIGALLTMKDEIIVLRGRFLADSTGVVQADHF